MIISTLVVYAVRGGGHRLLLQPSADLRSAACSSASPGSLATKYAVSVSWLSGLPPAIPFIVLFLALVVTPKARLAERRVVTTLPVRKAWYAPWRVRLVVFAAGHRRVCALFPNLVGDHLAIWASFLADAILLLSLGLLVRVSGQISLCHLAFAAVGAAAFGHFADSYHFPWLLALLSCHAGRRAGRGHRLDPGHPAVRLVPGARHTGLRDPLQYLFYSTSLMFGLTTVGHPGSAARK